MQINVLEYLESTALRSPNKIAFKDDNSRITFSSVLKQSKAIGSYLAVHTEPCCPVIVFCDKNIIMPVCFMGIVYSGCYYVPLDVHTPIFRIKHILNTVDAKLMLTDKNNLEKARTLDFNGKILLVDEILYTIPDEEKLCGLRKTHTDASPLYVVFTSGSTGIPKGVVASHSSVIDYIDAFIETVKIDETDVMASQSPFDYDGSIRDIYGTFKTGATTYIMPQKYFSTPIKLFEKLNEHKVTSLSWAVSALTIPVTMNVFSQIVPKYVKRVMFSGSIMSCKTLSVWQKYLSEATYINHYGPTECTATSTYYIVPDIVSEDDVLPIGKPFPNIKILLLNEEGQAVQPREIGEIYISGSCVSVGYYKNPSKTAEVFIQNPLNPYYNEIIYKTGDLGSLLPDGNLAFHGRKDSQIKHMGHRIELGEIEAAALSLGGINSVSCLYKSEKEMIWLFYTGEVDKKEFAVQLRNRLPGFMVPRKFVKLDKMPKLPNGKININELKDMMGTNT